MPSKKLSLSSSPLHVFFLLLSYLATIIAFGVVLIILLFTGQFFEALLFFWLLATTTSVVYAIKYFYPTKRPDHAKQVKKAKFFWQKVDLSTFPSAHAARTSALVLISILSFSLPIILFSLFFFVIILYARVKLKRHYWNDVLWGSVFGALLGWLSWFLTTLTFPLLNPFI